MLGVNCNRVQALSHTSFPCTSPSPGVARTKGNISNGSSNPISLPRGSFESDLITGTFINGMIARTSPCEYLQSWAGIADMEGLRMTPMPTQSDHRQGTKIARTRDSVTREESSRAVVAKAARSAEDEGIAPYELWSGVTATMGRVI